MLVNSHVRARPRPFNTLTPFSTFEPLLSPPSAAAAHWSDISLDSKAAIPPQAKNFKHSISQSTGRGGEILTRHKRVTQGEDTWYTMPMQWTCYWMVIAFFYLFFKPIKTFQEKWFWVWVCFAFGGWGIYKAQFTSKQITNLSYFMFCFSLVNQNKQATFVL